MTVIYYAGSYQRLATPASSYLKSGIDFSLWSSMTTTTTAADGKLFELVALLAFFSHSWHLCYSLFRATLTWLLLTKESVSFTFSIGSISIEIKWTSRQSSADDDDDKLLKTRTPAKRESQRREKKASGCCRGQRNKRVPGSELEMTTPARPSGLFFSSFQMTSVNNSQKENGICLWRLQKILYVYRVARISQSIPATTRYYPSTRHTHTFDRFLQKIPFAFSSPVLDLSFHGNLLKYTSTLHLLRGACRRRRLTISPDSDAHQRFTYHLYPIYNTPR